MCQTNTVKMGPDKSSSAVINHNHSEESKAMLQRTLTLQNFLLSPKLIIQTQQNNILDPANSFTFTEDL